MRVHIETRAAGSRRTVSETELLAVLNKIVRTISIRADALTVSVAFIPAQRSKALSTRYRGVAHVADVLTFPVLQTPIIRRRGSKKIIEGEILLCPEQIARRAQREGQTVHNETLSLFAHGVLHLLGYDHEHDKEARVMERLEERIAGVRFFRGRSRMYGTL